MTGVLTADGLLRRLGLPAVAVLYALYVAYFVQLTSLPLQDYPNHVARAVVLGDLIFHDGARFGEVFSFHIVAAPYLLTDLLLTVCLQLFGAKAGLGFLITVSSQTFDMGGLFVAVLILAFGRGFLRNARIA